MRTRLNKRTAAPYSVVECAIRDLRAAPWIPPFRVRFRDLTAEGILGACTRGPGGVYTLTLHAPLVTANPSAAVLLICHEVGHILSWSARGQSDHGPSFGKAYARCWRYLHPTE